jgi:hypothetical protein
LFQTSVETILNQKFVIAFQENRAKAERKRNSRSQDDDSAENNCVKIAPYANGDAEGGFVKSGDPYFYVRKSGEFAGATQAPAQRPVTVRSVKRRDKAKTEEKNNRSVTVVKAF